MRKQKFHLYKQHNKTKKMKKYNFFYYGRSIPRANFEKAVPENWEDEVNEYGCYSWGGYEAIEIDEDEE